VYEDFMVDVLAIPILTGRKTERERFSGATTTWTCEAMMRDGKALQMGTSHELGQNFARVFNTTFLDESGREELVWQTSWGASSRLMGALVMAHGDDAGLRLPPRLAPIEVVVVLVRDEEGAREKAAAIADRLSGAGLRTRLDTRTETSFGRRVVDWELKGVPVRVEVGPRELDLGEAVLVRRDSGTKTTVPLAGLETAVRDSLDEAQAALLAESLQRRLAATTEVFTVEEAEEVSRTGFAMLPVAILGDDGETRLNQAGATVRLVTKPDGTLPDAEEGAGAELVAVVARAY
jgi:prolyl-tRNA synthetase